MKKKVHRFAKCLKSYIWTVYTAHAFFFEFEERLSRAEQVRSKLHFDPIEKRCKDAQGL